MQNIRLFCTCADRRDYICEFMYVTRKGILNTFVHPSVQIFFIHVLRLTETKRDEGKR